MHGLERQLVKQRCVTCLQQALPPAMSLRLETSGRLDCRAGAADSVEPSPKQEKPKSKQEMLARIQKAKQYRESAGTATPGGQQQAAPQGLSSRLQSVPQAQAVSKAPPSVLTTVLPAATAQQSAAAVTAKKAKDISSTGYSSFGEVPEEVGDYEEGKRFTKAGTAAFAKARSSGFSRLADSPGKIPTQSQAAEPSGDATDPLNGTAQQAAEFLRDAFTPDDQQQNPDERPEIFTLLQEDRQKRQGADIVSVGQNYSATTAAAAQTAAADAADYTPKVSTWGRFPRPSNISECVTCLPLGAAVPLIHQMRRWRARRRSSSEA